ncbi:MAG: 2-oxoglutarate dehydrogenase complex dihydrolipoyllysine-residue succinyltransferase [Phycisphaerales bacterium]|nr:2-oxoglutarate dehydrogenase complex dihydrolipoyllysine-residue succinyltransferase [Phycisphaerales bacterium]
MVVDIVIPSVGESVTSGVVTRWVKSDGDAVKKDDIVLELETDKVTLEVRAPESGQLKHVAKAGDTVDIGAIVAKVDTAAAGVPASAPAPQPVAAAAASPAAPAHASNEANGDVRATPLARKIAAEHGVDLAEVNATGAGGRVREQDVTTFVESRKPAAATAAAPAKAPSPAKTAAGPRDAAREKMTPLRQRIAQRLVQSQQTAAILTTFNECDMGAVMDLRKRYKDDFEKKHGIALGFMGFFVKAVVQGLKAFPLVNAFIVEENGQPMIERHNYCDVAIAVSTPKGLVVPVIRNADTLSLAEIELAIKDLATRARDGKLSLDEMQGGTFTITNGGVFGSLLATPIINPPQSGILGMHTIKSRPVEYPVGSGQIALRPMMYVALSYDHRIIDGAESVQFLIKVKQAIEDPQRLLLDV